MTKIFNKKTGALSALSTVLLLAVIMPSMPLASAGDTTCTGFLAAGTYDGNINAPGPFCLLGFGVTVNGDVKQTGGDLLIAGATINGNIQAEGGHVLSMNLVTVNGDIQVKGYSLKPTTTSFIGIQASSIDGNIQIEESTLGFLNIGFPSEGNVINGDIQIFKNLIAFSFIAVSDNTVNGDIKCKENIIPVPFTNIGSPNTVSGNTEDQCAGL